MKTLKYLVPIVAVAAAIVWGCGGSSTGATSATGGGPAAVVSMTGSHSFSPVNVTVPAGKVVQWTNTDTTHHTVASDTNQSGMNSDGQYPTGLPGSSTFNWTVPANATSGTVYYYHCEFHGAAGNGTSLGAGMAGSVTVQ